MSASKIAYSIIGVHYKLFDISPTPLKLQKLLYYVYVWSLIDNKKLFNGSFEKWKYGPVDSSTYHIFKQYHDSPIPVNEHFQATLTAEQKKFIEFVVNIYGKYNALTLSSMTHLDDPWKKTPESFVIPDKLIKKFYSKLNFAKNFPVEKDKPFYPIESDSHYSFVLDFYIDKGNKSFKYSSYKEYLKLESKSKLELKKSLEEWIQF